MNKYCYLSGRVNMKVCDFVVLHSCCSCELHSLVIWP